MTTHADDIAKKAFFNERADSWFDTWYKAPANGGPKFEKEFERLFNLAPVRPDDRVVDAGCGSGVLVPFILARLGPAGRLFEVDYAGEMIKANRKLHPDPRIEFLACDIMEAPIPLSSCSLVLCFSCFPHFRDKPGALRAMAGFLMPGGRLIIAHFDSAEDLNRRHRCAHPAVMRDTLPGTTAMRGLFEQAGLAADYTADEPGFYAVAGRKIRA